MKKIIQGKEINEWPAINCINYFGDTFYAPHALNRSKVTGEFIARKYNSILDIIGQTKAKVYIKKDAILIEHANGSYKVCRDILVDSFLMPAINKAYGFNSIEA